MCLITALLSAVGSTYCQHVWNMCLAHVRNMSLLFFYLHMCMWVRWFLTVVIGWLVVTLRPWRGFDGTTDLTTID